jgi:hypothetical protein
MPVEVEQCPKCGAVHGEDHTVTTVMPKASIIRGMWKKRNYSRATDGCRIGFNEPFCKHGHANWRDLLRDLKIKGRPLRPEEIIEDDDALDWTPEEVVEEGEEIIEEVVE